MPLSLTPGRWRLVKNPRHFIDCQPGEAGDWALGNPLTYHAKLSEYYGTARFAYQLTGGERAKYTSLVVKAVGAERVQGLLNRKPPASIEPSPREASDLDAAARLERAARLRDAGIITEEDFARLKARYLAEL